MRSALWAKSKAGGGVGSTSSGVGLDGGGGIVPPAIIASRSSDGTCGGVLGGAGAPARPRGGFEGIRLAWTSVVAVRVRDGWFIGCLVPPREW